MSDNITERARQPMETIPETVILESGIGEEITKVPCVVLRDIKTQDFLSLESYKKAYRGPAVKERHVFLLKGNSTRMVPPGSVIRLQLPKREKVKEIAYLKIEEFQPDIKRSAFPIGETTLRQWDLQSMKIKPTGCQIIRGRDLGSVDLDLAITNHKGAYEGNMKEVRNTPLGKAYLVDLGSPIHFV